MNVEQIALEVTKVRFPEEPISIVRAHGVPGIDGMLSKRKTKGDWCISYDESVSVPGRINFTLGHELGHYLLHRSTRDLFSCGQSDLLDYHGVDSRNQESEANTFASFLLMPINDFRAQIEGHSVTPDLLGHCAGRYGTSFTAATLKWLEFTGEAAMLVVSDADDFVCWSYPSMLARKLGAYIAPGTPVSHSVLENLRGSSADKKNRFRRVNAGVWHPKFEAEESIVLSDRFELAIFLIRFPFANLTEYFEDVEEDSFSFLMKRAQGLNWRK